MTGGYTGPQPDTAPISSEQVVVQSVRMQYQGQIALIVERVRFAEAGDWHNVNRVVKVATTAETQAKLTELAPRIGDSLTISTEFSGVSEASGSYGVRRWPGHRAIEYPMGTHLLTSVARHH
jgi:hypothetical protein